MLIYPYNLGLLHRYKGNPMIVSGPEKWPRNMCKNSLHWHQNECCGVSNLWQLKCLLKHLFRLTSKKILKPAALLTVCKGNPPVDSPHKGPVMQKAFPYHDAILWQTTTIHNKTYRKISNISGTKISKLWMFFTSSCSCLCPIQWSQVLSREWRCSWSSADRRYSDYIWVINNFIAY